MFLIEDDLKNNEVHIFFLEYGHSEEKHDHEAIEIQFVIDGQGENIVNDESIRTKRGTMIMMGCDCAHELHVWETMKYYNVLFKASFLDNNLQEDWGLKEILKRYYNYNLEGDFLHAEIQDEETINRIERLLFNILNEKIEKKERHEELTKCYFNEFVNLFLRNIEEKKDEVDFLFSQVIGYIEDNCSKNLQLEEVAKKFNYKPKYLSNKLKEYCGLSFKQILIRKRLDNVIYHLCKTDETIDDIILKCGFTNKTYFYDIFEKIYGIKPKFVKEYSKNYNRFMCMLTKRMPDL